MLTIDTAQLAPAAAAVTSNDPMRKLAHVTLTNGDMEATVEMSVSYDLNTGFYHGQAARTTKKLDPAAGRMILVMDGPHAPVRARLLSTLDMWSRKSLDAMYAKAFETLTARLAAGDEKVTAILAPMED